MSTVSKTSQDIPNSKHPPPGAGCGVEADFGAVLLLWVLAHPNWENDVWMGESPATHGWVSITHRYVGIRDGRGIRATALVYGHDLLRPRPAVPGNPAETGPKPNLGWVFHSGSDTNLT